MARLRRGFERLLEIVVYVLMAAIAVEVTVGVVYRSLGQALAWYEEISVILLAWITFYGSALAALKKAHIGVPGVVAGFGYRWRLAALLAAETLIVLFFALLAWVGTAVLEVLATDTLVSLPNISVAWTQSAIPIGAVLFIAAELLVLPERIAAARHGGAAKEIPAADVAERLG